MKKFLLKEKQLLSKKLQQFDIEPVIIDYVAQQTPAKLKQPLSVLREGQIDLQDSHEHQAYFKNYPNHHISHYLLDKLKSLDAERQRQGKQGKSKIHHNGYNTPTSLSSYVPPFDASMKSWSINKKTEKKEFFEKMLLCLGYEGPQLLFLLQITNPLQL